MITRTPANSETLFNRGAWLTLLITIALLAYGIADLAYRFTLPTDGWEVSENELPGFAYTRNLAGNPSGLQAGDQVIAVEGIPADWQTVHLSSMLRESWRVGATLEYTVIRGDQEIGVPVTLMHWRIRRWLRVILLDPVEMVGRLSGIVLFALAALVFFRRPRNPASGAFLIIMTLLTGPRFSETLPLGFPTSIDPVAYFLDSVLNWYLLLALFPFALIQFALVFPHPKPIQQRHPWLAYGAGAVGFLLQLLAPNNPVGWFWFVFALFLAVAILIHNAVTMRDAVSRAQMRWGLGGLIIGLGTLTLMFLIGTSGLYLKLSPEFFNVTFTFATTVMGVMLAVAITRYRLFDIDIIIRRTLVYTTLTGMLALVYLGSVVLLQTLVGRATDEQSPLIIVLSTLLIAALFSPLRRRLQVVIDRRFFRQRYDAQQVLAHFAQTARDEVELEALTAELAQVIGETMQPEGVRIWLNEVNE